MFTVVAEKVDGKPNEIPISKWLIKDTEYTVIEVSKCNGDRGKYGYKLAEIDLSSCAPYLYFDASRFRILSNTPVLEEELELEIA